jgi:ATP-dependent RNA helicase DDX55/SPB4
MPQQTTLPQELPLGPLAASMGLLKLPRMPELKKGSAANNLAAFTPSTVDPDSVRFRDKARERQRQQVGRG